MQPVHLKNIIEHDLFKLIKSSVVLFISFWENTPFSKDLK